MSLMQLSNNNFNTVHALKKWLKNPGQGRNPFDLYDLKRKLGQDAKLPPSTHTELMGGQYVVPPEYNDEFLWYLAVSLHQNKPSSLVERRTEFFRYHLDMDFAESEVVTLARLRPYMVVVIDVVRRFFPFASNNFLECAICAADSTKEVTGTDGKTKQLKSGFHIMFPHIWVHTDQALAIRADLIVHLTKQFGERKQPFKNNWADVVDESVYVGSGLRVIAALKVSQCKNPACKEKWSRSKKKPPPPPQIEGVPGGSGTNVEDEDDDNLIAGEDGAPLGTARGKPKRKTRTSASKKVAGRTSVSASAQVQAPSGDEIYRALTSSSSGALSFGLTTPRAGAQTTQPLSGDGQREVQFLDGECQKCDSRGRVIEGRPYYLVALWDVNCNDLMRTVKVPKEVTEDTPRYACPIPTMYPDAYHISDLQVTQVTNQSLPRNVYFAMSMPHWTPVDQDDDDDEDDGVRAMDIGLEENVEDDKFVTVQLRDLLVFGDPFRPSGEMANSNQAWNNVRRLHNTFRLTTLRSPPALQRALQVHYANTSDSAMNDEVVKHCPHFVRPRDAPGYSNHYDALRRHNMGGIFSAPHSGVRLEHSAEAKWARAVDQGKKGYVCDDEVLRQVETAIRKNVGIRPDLEDSHPYGSLDVSSILFNISDSPKQTKPKSYLVLVNGFGSSYCMNKGDSHNSNKIYFIITKDGIQQRCHCTCKIDRKNGYCATFKSTIYELPFPVMKKLFPGTTDAHDYMPGREDVDLDIDVAPRTSIVNFDPQRILAYLPTEIPIGALPFSDFLKRKREQERVRYGLDDPEDRLQKILVLSDNKSDIEEVN